MGIHHLLRKKKKRMKGVENSCTDLFIHGMKELRKYNRVSWLAYKALASYY